MSAEIAPLLYHELAKINAHPLWDARNKVLALGALMERLFLEATRREQLAFSSLFARISYAGHLHGFEQETLQRVHRFRRISARVRDGATASDREIRLGIMALAETVGALYPAHPIPAEIRRLFPAPGEWRFDTPEAWSFRDTVRVVAMADIPEENCLLAVDEETPGQTVRVRYGLPERNENFMPTIRLLRQVFGFPTTICLLEVEIDQEGAYRPRVFVLEPDYLVDVTAVAESFKDHGAEPLSYLVKKFLPYEVTPPILMGNVANYFLDRLLNDPDAPFDQVLRETFALFPLAYAPMSDKEVLEIRQKAQKHYLNLRQMARGGLARQGIESEQSVLEPTFYSERYGLQGRLDLFYRTPDKAAIVELKSGQPFKPNSYGIQRSHFTQTLLYDLLVKSVFGADTDPAKYILYSGADLNILRFAPTIAPEQWEALQVRNQLVGIERLLAGVPPGADNIPLLNRLTAQNGSGKGFLQRDFTQFENAYTRLSTIEKKYFNSFAGFIAREAMLAKVGAADSDAINGNAALWRSSFEEKQQGFSILSHLKIIENHADREEPWILFQKTAGTNPLANFRVGDIAVLYPAKDESETVLNHQVIKCTITSMDPDRVTVQLRYRQFNLYPFQHAGTWNLEPDMLETGFTGMYRSLFEWAAAPGEIRKRVAALSTEPSDARIPDGRSPGAIGGAVQLTPEQSGLLLKIIRAPHYFLLWGPPGTGKTSVMLHAYTDWVLRETNDNLLLLAYTNRAVDEICEAIEQLGGNIRDQYLRIGSRFATAERFREQLLQHRIAAVSDRATLREVLGSRRIVVGTVASFAQNDNLMRLKKFQRLVVDEASQLLEPQLIGLLTRFNHYVLIGDHRQLPAVTTQNPEWTRVSDPELNNMGLTNLCDSYFERLYLLAMREGWNEVYGRLSHQGRMHRDIMAFPNVHFYNGLLQTLPQPPGGNTPTEQESPLQYQLPEPCSDLEQHLAQHRVVFLPAVQEDALPGQKTSRAEAEMIVQIIRFFRRLFAENGLQWHPLHALGVITPWRAQIAQIRECLNEAGEDPDAVTIDTVERYQGGARQVILLSCCVHSEQQLASLVNLSGEGVDRKLNVALTRARRHVIVLGNSQVLEKDERYRAFIRQYRFGS